MLNLGPRTDQLGGYLALPTHIKYLGLLLTRTGILEQAMPWEVRQDDELFLLYGS